MSDMSVTNSLSPVLALKKQSGWYVYFCIKRYRSAITRSKQQDEKGGSVKPLSPGSQYADWFIFRTLLLLQFRHEQGLSWK